MQKRNHFSSEQKVIILRDHLENQVPLSDLSESHHVHINLLYRWKKELFESAKEIFDRRGEKLSQSDRRTIDRLEEKLRTRDALISELVQENIRLKKSLHGES